MHAFHCSCGYTAQVQGGEHEERGVRTSTMVCSSCRELVDVVQSSAQQDDERIGRCPRCDSAYQRPWTARACPRCTRTMSRSRS